MRHIFAISFLLLLAFSCIPLRVAPKIEDYQVARGKKFNRKLPQREMFIFQDPKEALEFYNYIDAKFQLNHEHVYDDVPFEIDGAQFFFSFYEVEIANKTLELFPTMFDFFVGEALGWEDMDPILSDGEVVKRQGNWYVAIEVYSDAEKDCLASTSFSRSSVLNYLTLLKNEYISNPNFEEVQDKN